MTLMSKTITGSLEDNALLSYFNHLLMGYDIDGYRYSPDINGYVFIFMEQPDLSGYKIQSKKLEEVTKLFGFLALDFTPPAVQVVSAEFNSRSGSLPYGTDVNSKGNITISFLDTSDLDIFGMHHTWIKYIEDVTRGVVSPDSKYYSSGSEHYGCIDYASSAYVVRFKPSHTLEWGDIVYVGKAVGIFPIGLPDKEVIGRRDTNELTMLPITYTASMYRQQTYGTDSLNNPEDWIYKEMKQKCLDHYSTSG